MDTRTNTVLFGYAEVDITPTASVELVGFSRKDNLSRGILSSLIAQIMIWDDSIEIACIVSIDSLGFTVEKSNTLRGAIAEKLHVEREKVMVCFTHTHSAPNAGREKAYYDSVCTKILEGINKAVETLAPIRAVWGNTEADIGVNRRNKDGILDRRIGVLKIVDDCTNQLRAIVLRVSAHANVLSSDNYFISSDFVGVARNELEKRYGCNVVITQGSSGNIRPMYQHSNAVFMEEHPNHAESTARDVELEKRLLDESMDALARMATEINSAVGGIIDVLVPQQVYRLCMFSETGSFAADVPTMQQAKEIADEAKLEADIDGTSWLLEVERLHNKGIRRQNAEIEMQYFTLNDGCLCGIPNEAMCEIAVDISLRANNRFIYFGGYTNGCDGYLPTEVEYKKGGYEVLWSYLVYYQYHGRVMPLNPDAAGIIVKSVVDKWDQINDSKSKKD